MASVIRNQSIALNATTVKNSVVNVTAESVVTESFITIEPPTLAPTSSPVKSSFVPYLDYNRTYEMGIVTIAGLVLVLILSYLLFKCFGSGVRYPSKFPDELDYDDIFRIPIDFSYDNVDGVESNSAIISIIKPVDETDGVSSAAAARGYDEEMVEVTIEEV